MLYQPLSGWESEQDPANRAEIGQKSTQVFYPHLFLAGPPLLYFAVWRAPRDRLPSHGAIYDLPLTAAIVNLVGLAGCYGHY